MGGSHDKGLVLYRRRGMSGRGGGWLVKAGCKPASIGAPELRVLQGQGTARLPCQASWPRSMRCLPFDQQRAIQVGAALGGEHDLERGAVAPELRVGPAGGCARLPCEPAAQT